MVENTSQPMNVAYSITPDRASVFIDGLPEITYSSPDGRFTTKTGNFALMAALFEAIVERRPLHIRGSVDGSLLRNATLISHYWGQWFPNKYSPVLITADEILLQQHPRNGRLICLSGGVDSTYALLTANLDDRPYMRFETQIGLSILGFDYARQHPEPYRKLLENVRNVAATVDMEVASVETNWKEIIPPKSLWNHNHGVGLAAVQHLFSDGNIGGGALGSDYNYREDHIVAPWGSNPITNRMFGSSGFPIETFGEHSSRIQKLEYIHQKGLLSHLRVCWAGPRTGDNCGRCEKCIRTMLNCEALGIDSTPAFGRRLVPNDLLSVRLPSRGAITFLRQSVTHPGSQLSKPLKRAAELTILKASAKLRVAPYALPAKLMLRRRLRPS